MIEGKGLGGKRVNRVGLSLTNEYESKLMQLATSCGKKKTPFANFIIERCLDDELFVDALQKEYCKQKAYKIRLVKRNGKIHYVLAGREDI
ncbi:hypothetical protein V7152_15110 [Neobacillus drentensis]|uniref:hypothetical protein n=1 Tax=Neobacillus drentensis TaxID=220684 RepID=UPI0030009746